MKKLKSKISIFLPSELANSNTISSFLASHETSITPMAWFGARSSAMNSS